MRTEGLVRAFLSEDPFSEGPFFFRSALGAVPRQLFIVGLRFDLIRVDSDLI